MQHAVGVFRLRYMSIPGFWYLSYLAMIFIPSFFVFFGDEVDVSRYTYLFAVQSVVITVPFGILFINILLKFRVIELKEYYEHPLQEQYISPHLFAVCLMGLLGAWGVMLMYVLEVRTLPLLYMLRNPGDYETLVLLREDAFKLLDSKFVYIYSLLRIPGFPFLIMLTFGYYLVTRRRRWLYLFLSLLGSGVLFAGFDIEKGPVAAIVLLIFFFSYLYWGGRIRKRTYIVGSLLVMLFPFMVEKITGYGMDVDAGAILGGLLKRLYYGPALVLYWYFELFPGTVGYLYGRSIGKLAWIMGSEHFDTANYVGLHGLHSRIDSVHANAAFIGNLNADFGIVGVVLGGIAAGIIMQIVQIYLLRRPKTISNLVAYAYCMYAFWLLHSTALPVVLASNGVLLALCFPGIMHALASFLRGTLKA